MADLKLDQLEKLARAATPGPWTTHIDGTCSGASPRIVTDAVDEYGEPFDIADLSTSHVETEEARNSGEMPGTYQEKPHRFELTHDGEQVLADAAFIAAANPAVVLALIAELRAARAAVPAQAGAAEWEPCGWIQFIGGVQTQNFARDEEELTTVKHISEVMRTEGKIEYVQVYRPAATNPPAQVPAPGELSDTEIKRQAKVWYNDPNRDIAPTREDAYAMGMMRARAGSSRSVYRPTI